MNRLLLAGGSGRAAQRHDVRPRRQELDSMEGENDERRREQAHCP